MENYSNSTSSATDPIIVGLDVHKDSISACAFAPSSGEILHEQKLPNQPAALKKLLRRIQRRFGEPHCVYEASSCGFVLYRMLRDLGIRCDVIAPSSIPRRSGDHVKNDRRDAEKLATLHAASLLTPVRVPDPEHEAARALVRCRAALVEELTRAKKRTTQLLLTRGLAFHEGSNWSQKFRAWLAKIQLEEIDQIVLETYMQHVDYLEAQIRHLEARIEELAHCGPYAPGASVLRAFRGIDTITAMTLLLEIGDIRRFEHPRQLMAYLGLVPNESSSGDRVYRGAITKAGNARARSAIVSAAWKYAARPRVSHALKKRQAELPAAVAASVITTSWKAQQRLYKRFHALCFRRPRQVAAVAIARELAGFLWEAMQLLSRAEMQASNHRLRQVA